MRATESLLRCRSTARRLESSAVAREMRRWASAWDGSDRRRDSGCDMAGRHRRFRSSILGSPERRPFRSLHIDLEKTNRSLGGHCEGGTVGWGRFAPELVRREYLLGEHCSVGINDDRATWRAGWRRTPSGLSLDLVTSCSPAFERHTVAVGAAR